MPEIQAEKDFSLSAIQSGKILTEKAGSLRIFFSHSTKNEALQERQTWG
jgi:hypothetical protein